MRLAYNQSFPLSLIVVVLLLVANQAFSFGIHRQPISSHNLQQSQFPEPKHRRAVFNRPSKLSAGNSSLNQSSETVCNQSENSRTPAAYSYHLLWTPGFARKLMLSTLLLTVGHNFVFPHLVASSTSNASMGWISSFLLSLLASSCCLIQMIANVLISTVGCLGLNTALGPVRPYFFSLLLYVNALTIKKGLSTIPQMVMRTIIALLPEGLHLWTNYRNKRYQSINTEVGVEAGDVSATVESSINSSNGSFSKEVSNDRSINMVMELDVPTMGCVACINKIDRLLRQSQEQSTESNKVRSVSSILDAEKAKGGKAVVKLSVGSTEEAEKIGNSLVEQLDKLGFPGASIISKETVSR
ncbi:unnamed protein product [Cylindrotheca closterium]|uniref:HMA domain-containing protein n=1 Tax=Cylindrotheca closterium TaxID=2856 RepID=A0AAD2FLD1_9STRA|nr:unnamed protein product [Cylindrotheca closterium]